MPGVSFTIEILSPAIALNSVDFPTFGLPTIATIGFLVTRDRIYADVNWLNWNFTMIDTGGIEPDSKDIILSQMREQAQIAIDTADVIIFLVDVRQGLVDVPAISDTITRFSPAILLMIEDFPTFGFPTIAILGYFCGFRAALKQTF